MSAAPKAALPSTTTPVQATAIERAGTFTPLAAPLELLDFADAEDVPLAPLTPLLALDPLDPLDPLPVASVTRPESGMAASPVA